MNHSNHHASFVAKYAAGKRSALFAAAVGMGALTLAGCGGQRQAAAPMAPPVMQSAPMTQNAPMTQAAPPMSNGMGGSNIPVSMGQGGVYNWQDVPAGQQVGIAQGQFDQGGYQLATDSGDTIVVPFVNQNLYVMRFGRTNGQTYFVNDNGVPTLFLAPNAGLMNANANGAMWYPLPATYNYTRPVYVGLAPSWSAFTGMGWYPGMMMYGGMYGYNPYNVGWMPGYNIFIGGNRYNSWDGYHSYYMGHPGYYRPSLVYTNYNTRLRGSGSYRYSGAYRPGGATGSYRPGGATGSYRPGSASGSYRPGNSGGSFSRPSGTFNSGAYSPARPTNGFRPSGAFNSGAARPSGTFNSGATSGGFGGRPSGSFGGFGGSRPSGSFGGGSSGYSAPSRPSGGSFGGGGGFSRPSGSFGGGGRSSGSFGGGGGRRR